MYATVHRLKMISTSGGMRRILKNKGSVANYIRQAVQAGTYRSEEELQAVYRERRDSSDDLKTIMRRFRQDIVRGTAVHDYPVEYRILQQHPPVPDPPRTPVKWLRKLKPEPNPVRKLASKYLNRLQNVQHAPTLSAADYYERLLGVSKLDQSRVMGQKTAATSKAYAVAVKQFQLQRVEGLSERQALQQVEDLLQEQNVNERVVSRERAESLRDWQNTSNQTKAADTMKSTGTPQAAASKSAATNSLPFVVNARTAQGMMGWSGRLQTVPYKEWTVGASTALDHWIAKSILDLSEETWQSLLEGQDPDLLGRGRDIVAVREALFPETTLDAVQAPLEHDAEEAMTLHESEASEKTIEELLASLGGLNTPKESSKESWNWLDDDADGDKDAKVMKLVEELQGWRKKNVAAPYAGWSDKEKKELRSWTIKYVEILVPDAERGRVNLDTTREALLSEPPTSAEDSETFWSQLENEGDAAEFLSLMRKDGPPAGAGVLQAAFWGLPYDEQLERLLNLGALRPLLDEYTTESKRTEFLQRHSDTLLSGVELEHLVEDPDGPIRYEDIDGTTVEELGVSKEARFRLEMKPYQSSEEMSAQEKTRILFMAWNQHKAGRARYEEKLFQSGRLGLRYGDRLPTDDDNGVDDDGEKR
jgi:hypothetical protein